MRQRVEIGLHHELCQFLFHEAELLDDGLFEDWLALFAPEARYRVPIRTNRLARERDRSLSRPGELHLFDDDKESLSWRVGQMASDRHWAEDPPSRTRHLVSNVRARPAGPDGHTFTVRSNFLCYRNRLADEVDLWAGERHDVLRRPHAGDVGIGIGIGMSEGNGEGERDGWGWLISERTVLLDQSVVLSKNLSVFL